MPETGKCFIITAFCPYPIRECAEINPGDYIICADRAYVKAMREGFEPSLIIGDFDSEEAPVSDTFPSGAEIMRFPSEKDDTDTMLCVKEAIKRGFSDIAIIGGIGGRLDHTAANLQTLLYASRNGVSAVLRDKYDEAGIIPPGTERVFIDKPGYSLSLFAFGGDCGGVNVSGVGYPLENARLSPSFPLGVSNVITGDRAVVGVASGNLLYIRSYPGKRYS